MNTPLVALLMDGFHCKGNLSVISEFDRVGKEVEQNLTQTRIVSNQDSRGLRIDDIRELNSFGGSLRGDDFEWIGDRGRQWKRSLQNFQFPRFDFRIVENVRYQRKQSFATGRNGLSHLALRFRQVAQHQLRGHPDDCMERSPNLVTHRRKKRAFGFVRRFRQLLGVDQGFFGPFPLRQVDIEVVDFGIPIGQLNQQAGAEHRDP